MRGLKDGFTYQNETKVQNLVVDCLNDALTLLDLSEDFLVESEFSIFSYRPDVVVVSHSMLGVILVVEVKKPGVEVFTSHAPGTTCLGTFSQEYRTWICSTSICCFTSGS